MLNHSITVDTVLSTPPLTPDLSPISSLSSNSRHDDSLQLDVSSMSSIREPSHPTSTLIITSLSTEVFSFENLRTFKQAVSSIANISAWVPLKSFTRVIVSFKTIQEAQEVRTALSGFSLLQQPMRIFWGENSQLLNKNAKDSLAVPALEKNWLISPPGSPPVGWTQIREDPPNAEILHADLLQALAHLPIDEDISDLESDDQAYKRESRKAQTEITLLKDDESQGPGIVVHLEPSCNSLQSLHTSGIERTKVSMVRTPMPGY